MVEDKDYQLVVSLKHHFDTRFDAIDERLVERMEAIEEKVGGRIDAIEKATSVAYQALNHRLEGMNEFRDTLRDQAGRFVTREEMNLIVDRLKADIRNLEIAKATLEGKASQTSVIWSIAISVLGLVLAAMTVVTRYAPALPAGAAN